MRRGRDQALLQEKGGEGDFLWADLVNGFCLYMHEGISLNI